MNCTVEDDLAEVFYSPNLNYTGSLRRGSSKVPKINFPLEATAEEKLLILGSTLLIDYSFFESQSTYKRSAYLY